MAEGELAGGGKSFSLVTVGASAELRGCVHME